MKPLTAIFVVLLCCFCFVPSGYALMIAADTSASESGLGDFQGELNYSFISATSALLTLSLKNTSPVLNGGYLTALAFNNPFAYITSVGFSATDSDFCLLGSPGFNNGISAMPFGSFDIGAGISAGSFQGGGNPALGIAAGDSENFTFSFTGTNLDTLSARSFIDELSSGANQEQGNQFFITRFSGFEDEGSDKVPGKEENTMPEPASLFLLGAGLMAGLFKRRLAG